MLNSLFGDIFIGKVGTFFLQVNKLFPLNILFFFGALKTISFLAISMLPINNFYLFLFFKFSKSKAILLPTLSTFSSPLFFLPICLDPSGDIHPTTLFSSLICFRVLIAEFSIQQLQKLIYFITNQSLYQFLHGAPNIQFNLIKNMNEVTIKRHKFIRQLQLEQKENYFRKIRNQMISHMEQVSDIQQPTQNAQQLKKLLIKSIGQNQIIPEIRENQLLQKIQTLIKSTHEKRQLELALLLLSNILLDQITLEEKEIIVKLCLEIYSIDYFKNKQYIGQSVDATCMSSICQNIKILSGTLSYIDEALSQYCQKLIFEHIDCFTQEIIHLSSKEYCSQSQATLQQIATNIISTIKRLLYAEPEYLLEIHGRFQHFDKIFRSLLHRHFQLQPFLGTNKVADIFHFGFLQIEEFLTSFIDMEQHPLYFLSDELMHICMQEIFEERVQNCSEVAFNIFINFLTGYNNIYDIQVLIQNNLKRLDPNLFFKKMLQQDRLSQKRLTVLDTFLCSNQLFPLIEQFYINYWEVMVDLCCNLLNDETLNFQQSDIILKLLLVMNILAQNKKQLQYLQYLQSIRGESIIEHTTSVLEQHANVYKKHQDFQPLAQKCFTLLDIIRQNCS